MSSLRSRLAFLCFVFIAFVAVSCSRIAVGNSGTTSPASPDIFDYGLVALGDTGTGDGGQYSVAYGMRDYCLGKRCDQGILLGDNFYPRGIKSLEDDQWQTKFEMPYQDVPFSFYAALGNHDYRGSVQAQIDYHSKKWNMPQRYYDLHPSPDVDIFVVDTVKFDAEQIEWLGKKMDASHAVWKVVAGHQPVYSGGLHGDTRHLKKHLAPLLSQYKVAFFLSGHDHDLQIIERDKCVFVVAGGGSKFRHTKMTPASLFAKSSLGFAHIIFKRRRAVIKMVSERGEVLFEKVYQPRV